jgi:hypothetical protein
VEVQIVEIKTGKVAASVPIDLAGHSRIPSEQEFFSTAWRAAVEAKNVDPDRRDEYSFRLAR